MSSDPKWAQTEKPKVIPAGEQVPKVEFVVPRIDRIGLLRIRPPGVEIGGRDAILALTSADDPREGAVNVAGMWPGAVAVTVQPKRGPVFLVPWACVQQAIGEGTK